MRHNQKVALARRLVGGRMAVWDEDDGKNVKVQLFNNAPWNARRRAVAERVARAQLAAHVRAVIRKNAK